MTELILEAGTPLYATFQGLIDRRKLVFFAGLPGTGKSLLLKQLSLMALQAGRSLHFLQWDVTRAAFESEAWLARYPEVDGVTHPAIRKAVGLWARTAVAQWADEHPEFDQMLIGELPLLGNRLIELVKPVPDAAEPWLAGSLSAFVIPTPSPAVRQVIEATRARTIDQPQHEREAADAPPNVLTLLWHQVYEIAAELGLPGSDRPAGAPYDPVIYAGVYAYLLQHRRHEALPINTVLQPSQSVYDLESAVPELRATPAQVGRIFAQLETAYTAESLEKEVAAWHVMSHAAP